MLFSSIELFLPLRLISLLHTASSYFCFSPGAEIRTNHDILFVYKMHTHVPLGPIYKKVLCNYF